MNGGIPFEEGTETLLPGDKIILYTDGITERKNAKGVLFGTERLYALLEEIKNESVGVIVDTIRSALHDFAQVSTSQDDASAMCVEFYGGKP
jgi:sigma-B regulation protein RsbU (phosphoserine phosphatase)